MSRLWLDDIRTPPDESWLWAKNFDEGVQIMENNQIDLAAFDHDLGDEPAKTGYDFVRWMLSEGYRPIEIYLISNNPVGRKAQATALMDVGYQWIGSGDIGMFKNCDAYEFGNI